MIHAREDYQRIQDPAGRIAADEPVFLIRSTDVTGPDAVESWARLQYSAGGNREMARLAVEHAARMRGWQEAQPERVHVADMPSDGAAATMQGQPNPAEALADRFQRVSERLAADAQLAGRPVRFGTPEGMRELLVETCAAILRGET